MQGFIVWKPPTFLKTFHYVAIILFNYPGFSLFRGKKQEVSHFIDLLRFFYTLQKSSHVQTHQKGHKIHKPVAVLSHFSTTLIHGNSIVSFCNWSHIKWREKQMKKHYKFRVISRCTWHIQLIKWNSMFTLFMKFSILFVSWQN